MTIVAFLTAVLVFPCIVGLPVALHPTLGHLSFAARASLAWTSGSLVFTLILTLLSAVGLRWTPWLILLIGVPAIAAAVWMGHKNRMMTPEPRSSKAISGGLAIPAVAVIGGGSLFGFVVGAATSADLSYFWGVKALHFAVARGIDFDLLQQTHMIHLHPNYPPLWPVLLGWGATLGQSMPWLAIPSLTWVCVTAAAAVIFSILENRIGARAAAAVTCLWFAVLGAMMVTSFSGGNADGPLLLFLSIALVTVLTESQDEPRRLRWIAAVALAGAVFTKSEGAVAVALIVAGTAARDLIWRRPSVLREAIGLISPALAVLAFWATVRFTHGLLLADPIRETALQVRFDHVGLIARVCLRILSNAVVASGWIVPLVSVLIVGRHRLVRALPGFMTAFGILVFSAVYYLHAVGDPLQLIVWTFPRLMQPAMSAWILGFGVAAFSIDGESERHMAFKQGSIS